MESRAKSPPLGGVFRGVIGVEDNYYYSTIFCSFYMLSCIFEITALQNKCQPMSSRMDAYLYFRVQSLDSMINESNNDV